MRAERVHVCRRQLPLRTPYSITGEHIETADIVVLHVRTDDGTDAYGASAPSMRLTRESGDTVLHLLQHVAVPWLETTPLDHPVERLGELPGAFRTQPAARAAVDIAMHDLRAKQVGAPLRRWLGTRPDDMITSITIGICDVEETVRQAKARMADGFSSLKVKVGESLELDVERLRAIRKAVGKGVRLRVDANEGYDAEEACRFLDAMKKVKIDLLEQPTPRADIDGLKHVTEYAGRIPVMADESATSVQDALHVLDTGAASAINIKLMKCGGIGPARRILAAAREHRVPCMLGCMDESRISIAAAAHVALSDDQVFWADLDGHLDLVADVAQGGINVAAGYISVSDRPGLGVTVNLDDA